LEKSSQLVAPLDDWELMLELPPRLGRQSRPSKKALLQLAILGPKIDAMD
jgi:hypothetical protein